MALITLIDEITEAPDQGYLSKAFDTVDHGIILKIDWNYMAYRIVLWNGSIVIFYVIVCSVYGLTMLRRIKKMWNAEYHKDQFWDHYCFTIH